MDEDDLNTPRGRHFLMKMIAFVLRIVEQRGQVDTEQLWILMNSVSATCQHVDLFSALMNAHAIVGEETRRRDHHMYMMGWNAAWSVPAFPPQHQPHEVPEIQTEQMGPETQEPEPESEVKEIEPEPEVKEPEVKEPEVKEPEPEVKEPELEPEPEPEPETEEEIEPETEEKEPETDESEDSKDPEPEVKEPEVKEPEVVEPEVVEPELRKKVKKKKKVVLKKPPPTIYNVGDMTMDQLKHALVSEKDDNAILELEAEMALRIQPPQREYIGITEGCEDVLHRVIMYFTIGHHHYSFAIPLVMETSSIHESVRPQPFSKIAGRIPNDALQILVAGLEEITLIPSSVTLLQRIIIKLILTDSMVHVLTILATIYSTGIWGYIMASRATAANILMRNRMRSVTMDKHKIKISTCLGVRTMSVAETAVFGASMVLCGGYYHALDILRMVLSKPNIDHELARDIDHLYHSLYRFRLCMNMVSVISPQFPTLVSKWINHVGPTASLTWDMDGLSLFIAAFWNQERARLLSLIASEEMVDQKMSPLEMIGDNAVLQLMGQIPRGTGTLHDFVRKEEFLLLVSKMGGISMRDDHRESAKDVVMKLCMSISSHPSAHLEEASFVAFILCLQRKCYRALPDPLTVFEDGEQYPRIHQARVITKLFSFRTHLQDDIL